MESIVLALSGLSLLALSVVLRRTAAKNNYTVWSNEYTVPQTLQTKAEFVKPAFEGKALTQQPLSTLLSSESSSSLLHQ